MKNWLARAVAMGVLMASPAWAQSQKTTDTTEQLRAQEEQMLKQVEADRERLKTLEQARQSELQQQLQAQREAMEKTALERQRQQSDQMRVQQEAAKAYQEQQRAMELQREATKARLNSLSGPAR